MHQLILGFFLLSTLLNAITLEEIIDSSLSKSPSLEVIKARLEANKQNIKISNQFSNPELLLSKNTLDSSQAMSQTILTLKQKLPYYGKRDAKKSVALAQDEVLSVKLQNAKVALVQKIKDEAYTIWELQELHKITDEYIKLTSRNIELFESYTRTSDNQHMGLMKASLSLSDLKIQKNRLNAKTDSSLARLSYLADMDIKTLEITLSIEKKPKLAELQNSLSLNPKILLKEKELAKQNAKVTMAAKNNYPDINLLAGYSYRENFDDYLNIGIGITLPIYGTEDAKEQEARSLALVAQRMKEETTTSVHAELKVYYSQMLSYYEIYHIVQDESLPQIDHMFELSSSSVSTGSDLFKYIDILFSKLRLEKTSINAVSNYNRAQAKILQLTGALQ